MREIAYEEIVKNVRDIIVYSASNLPEDALNAMKEAYKNEKSPVSREVLKQLLENADIASSEARPLCQDTGLAVFFVKIGADVKVVGGLLTDAINDGTEKGYIEGYLRASTCHPFSRANNKDSVGYNLPAIIHLDIVEGNKIDIEYADDKHNFSQASNLKYQDLGIRILPTLTLHRSLVRDTGTGAPPSKFYECFKGKSCYKFELSLKKPQYASFYYWLRIRGIIDSYELPDPENDVFEETIVVRGIDSSADPLLKITK